jgi:hypothetical protein
MMARRTPNMGSGRWRKPLFPGLGSPAIARNERVASAGSGAFDARERDSPGNLAPARKEFAFLPKEKLWEPGRLAESPISYGCYMTCLEGAGNAPKMRDAQCRKTGCRQ